MKRLANNLIKANNVLDIQGRNTLLSTLNRSVDRSFAGAGRPGAALEDIRVNSEQHVDTKSTNILVSTTDKADVIWILATVRSKKLGILARWQPGFASAALPPWESR